MANAARRRAENVVGEFFVDDSCIDCGTCMWMAPAVFADAGGMSAVHSQPDHDGVRRRALQASVACPTASIGGGTVAEIKRARDSFPDPVVDRIWHLGSHARSSYGAASYLVATAAGNIMIDCPRFNEPLVKRLDEMGGVQAILFTHRDDVADHARFARHFGCQRMIHKADASAVPDAEIVFELDAPKEILPGITAIPVPGHTRGSICYLVGETLFTGDHLSWSTGAERLTAFRDACWFSWDTQIESMARLREVRFTRVLPGHGAPATLSAAQMQASLAECIEWMKA